MQKQIFSLFWQSAMKYPIYTAIATITVATTTVVGTYIGPYIISLLLTQLQNGNLTIDGAMPLILAFGATQIYGEIIGLRITMYCIWHMETAAQRDLYQRVFSALTEQSMTFHSNRFGGALVSQTTKLIGSFERFWDTITFSVIPTIASLVAATVILGLTFWQYAVFLAVLSIVFIICVFYGSRFMAKINKEEAQASTAANAYVADAVTNIMTIKSHGQERYELGKMTDRAETWRQKSLATMRGFLGVSTIYSSLLTILKVTALVAAIWAAEHHLASVGIVYLCLTYTFSVARQIWEMNNVMRSYNRIIGDAHDMTEILSLTPAVTDQNNKTLTVKNGTIAFDGVDFTHDGAADKLFNNFSLVIKPGQRVGLVGHSGSGKTTLTKLLLRFDNIEAGTISVDGQDIASVSQQSLRHSIAYVPQEPMLFHRSLRDNISYGKPDATDDDIRRAVTQANALEFIEKLPEGFETMVGERGVKLSGGQRQRIAIARAILKDSPILVLDEATSALDSESESLIQDALTKLMKDRTSIVVAHRLSTIAKLDRIIVLQNGHIAENGTHAQLIKQNGTYAGLWNHQSGGFIEE